MDKIEFEDGIEDLVDKENDSPKKLPLDIKIDNIKEIDDLIPKKKVEIVIDDDNIKDKNDTNIVEVSTNTKDTQTEKDKDSETLMTDFLDAIDDNIEKK